MHKPSKKIKNPFRKNADNTETDKKSKNPKKQNKKKKVLFFRRSKSANGNIHILKLESKIPKSESSPELRILKYSYGSCNLRSDQEISKNNPKQINSRRRFTKSLYSPTNGISINDKEDEKSLRTLKQLLVEDSLYGEYYFIHAILTIKTNNHKKKLCNALIDFYTDTGKINYFIESIIKKAVQIYPISLPELLFREDTLYTYLISTYIKKIASGYLEFCILPLRKFMEQKKSLELNTEHSAKNNAKELILVSQEFLNNICNCPEKIPAELRNIFRIITNEVTKHFSSNDAIKDFSQLQLFAISNVLFLRVVAPYILTSEFINHNREIILIMKTFCNLIINIEFGEKENFMKLMNPFINEQNIALINNFLKNIIDTESSLLAIKKHMIKYQDQIIKIDINNPYITENFWRFISTLEQNTI